MLQLKKEFNIDTNLQLFKQQQHFKTKCKKYNDLLVGMYITYSLPKLLEKQRDLIQTC